MQTDPKDAGAKRTRKAGIDILQVARRAGVSPATVSRVANGRTTVDKRLAKRVWQAIGELGYVPNPSARALVSGRTRTLGLLISEITNPFFPELIQAFEDIAGAHDFEVMVGSTNFNRERAAIFIRRLVQRRVEGVAVMTFRDESHLLDELKAHHIPLVSIEESTHSAESQVLEIDYYQGINEAIQHLGIVGHRRIAFAGGPLPHLTNVRRRDAFLRAVQAIGIAADASPVFHAEHTLEGGTQAAEHFLAMKKPPTAIACSNDLMAVGVLHVLAERRIPVPAEMSVVGFDDIHLAEFAIPPLSTVRMSRKDLALNAFNALQHMREGKALNAGDPIRIPTHFVLRKSTGSPKAIERPRKRATLSPA